MANHLQPTITSTYANFVAELDARFDDLAVGLDPAATTATNIPTNSIRFTSASNKWQKYNGSAWNDLAATYAIAISGNAATVTNGVYSTATYANPTFITSLAGSKITGEISGNAGTATKLFAARNINGVAFDGTAAISLNLNNSVTFNNAGGGAASGTAFSGGAAITVSYNTVGAPSTSGVNATGSWDISITGASATTGNAATVTNGVYTTGDQTIAGSKTFSSQIIGSISGNAATATTATTATTAGSVTNGVYTTGDQTIGGTKTFSSQISGNISGSAGSLNFAAAAGDAYFSSTGNNSFVSGNASIYYKVGGRIITSGNGSVRIKAVVTFASTEYLSIPAYYRIYKNGVAITGDITNSSGTPVTWTGDFTCATGDSFELYGRTTVGYAGSGRIESGFSTYTAIAPSLVYST